MIVQKCKGKRKFIGLISIVLMLFYICFILFAAKSNIVSMICDRLWKYYLLMGLMLLLVFFAVKEKKFFQVYVILVFSFFLWYSFADQSYSAIDETMNFESINHIIHTRSLPTFSDEIDYDYLNSANNNLQEISNSINYEAVQAPLYYIIFAMLGFIIKSAYFRLHFFRILGLCSIWIVYYFVNKTVKYLKTKQSTIVDEECLRAIYLLTLFNPGYLYRASRLNNEILVCILMAVLFYIAIKCIYEGYSCKYYWGMAVVSVALLMTKTTAVYAFCILAIVALFQKKIWKAILPVGVSSLGVVPWLIFNYKTYGRLTAMKEHLDFVLPIVNPKGVEQNWLDSIFGFFPNTFYSGEECNYLSGEIFWINLVFGIALAYLGTVIFSSLKQIKQREISNKTKLNVMFIVCLLSCFACLIMGTLSTKVNSIRGRYFYGPCIIFIYLIVANGWNLEAQFYKKYIKIIMVITSAVLMTRAVNVYLNNYYTQENLFASNVKNVEIISELSNDKLICIPYTEADKYKSYDVLQGHLIYCGNQKAIITSVSDVKSEGTQQYIELGVNCSMQNINDEKTLRIGRKISEIKYNVVNDLLENVEDQEMNQLIEIPENGELYGFSICLSTYCISDYIADVDYTIYDSNQNVLLTEKNNMLKIDDNSYSKVEFDKPINVKRGEKIYISVKYNNLEDKPLAVRVANANSGETLYINNESVLEKTLGLRLFISADD